MALKPIFELGVDEAYTILKDQLGVDDLPPLDAVENEDWGRDLLLGRLIEYPADALCRLGLILPARPGSSRNRAETADSDIPKLNPAVMALKPDQPGSTFKSRMLGFELRMSIEPVLDDVHTVEPDHDP